jgi:ankyrin repeat protein
MELLLFHRANPNVRDDAGDSPWHWAAQNGCQEMLEMLMPLLENPNATNNLGQTPAMVARAQGHLDVAGWLKGRALIADCMRKASVLALLDFCV